MFVIGAALLISGCTTPGGPKEEKPTMNMQQAAERADAILDKTFAAIKPPVNWTHAEGSEGSCDVSRARQVMTIISPERRGNLFGVVERHWKEQGYKHTSSNNSKIPATYFQTQDGFQISLLVGLQGHATFEVTTPCVEHSDVAPPKSKTVGPDYSGGELPLPLPNVRSDFWSSAG
ncbi:hypothetical protein ACH4SP_17875 [Streptomyces sp. NPDC021093]|uniref:hypothetical protein n=1 Tax=Streptomyces sp. NPDC021093 TaxID=3365112 RepID=UPI0037B8B5AE